VCEATGQPAGATLCLALASAVPPEALSVPHSSDASAALGADHQVEILYLPRNTSISSQSLPYTAQVVVLRGV